MDKVSLRWAVETGRFLCSGALELAPGFNQLPRNDIVEADRGEIEPNCISRPETCTVGKVGGASRFLVSFNLCYKGTHRTGFTVGYHMDLNGGPSGKASRQNGVVPER